MGAVSKKDARDRRTERPGPMGPRPTHVCLVRETRLLPPKAGRLASRSAKPTLDGSSLKKNKKNHERQRKRKMELVAPCCVLGCAEEGRGASSYRDNPSSVLLDLRRPGDCALITVLPRPAFREMVVGREPHFEIGDLTLFVPSQKYADRGSDACRNGPGRSLQGEREWDLSNRARPLLKPRA